MNDQTQLDPDVVNLSKAIRQVETGGDFNARGKSGEVGAYQYTPDTWNKTASRYGINVPIEQATPEQQNEVTYKQIKDWKDQGYNPGQIASMWNSGKPDAYLDTNYTGTNKYGAKYDVPAYAKSVATAYQAIKQGQNVGIDPNNPSATQPPSQGVGGFVDSLTKPFSEIGGEILGGLGMRNIGGLSPKQVGTGEDVAPITSARQGVGDVLQVASWLPFGAGAKVGVEAAQGVRPILSSAVQGAKDFAIAGGLQGTGQALSQGENTTQAINQGLESGLGAGVLGAGFGTLGYGVSKVGGLLSPELRASQQTVSDAATIAQRAKQLGEFDRYPAVQKVVSAAEKGGVDLKSNPYVQNAVSRSIDENGTIQAKEAIDDYRNFLSPQEGVVRDALMREGATVDARALQSQLERTMKQSTIQGADLTSALGEVKKEIADLKERFPDGKIPLTAVHDLKIYKSSGLNYLNPSKNIQDKAMASALRQTIENHSKNVEVKSLNKELQNHYRAIDYLEKLDGKKVTGGRIGRGLARLTGNIAGSKFGPLGSLVSGEVADRVYSKMLQNRLGGAKQVTAGMLKESPLMKKTVAKNKFYKQLQGQSLSEVKSNQAMKTKTPNTGSMKRTLQQTEKKSSGLLNTDVLKGFENSKPIRDIGGFELGTFGANSILRKSSQVDRIPASELEDTVANVKEAYRASNSPNSYRKDNIAWISEMPNGEKRVIYTRLNSRGKEEIINAHKISNDKYIEDLAKNGTPERTRTSNLLDRSELPYPLGDRSNPTLPQTNEGASGLLKGNIGLKTLMGLGAGTAGILGATKAISKSGVLNSKNEEYKAPQEKLYTLPKRKTKINTQDLNELGAILFGEIGNRSPEKNYLEAKTIANVALNRADKEGKPLEAILKEPKQFQALNGNQYKLFKEGKIDKLSEQKAEAIKKVIGEIMDGKLDNNIGENQSYAHRKDGTIRVYKDWKEQQKDLANI